MTPQDAANTDDQGKPAPRILSPNRSLINCGKKPNSNGTDYKTSLNKKYNFRRVRLPPANVRHASGSNGSSRPRKK